MYSLPSLRKVTWQGNVGVYGDIPNRTTQYGSTIAPSNDTTGITDRAAIQTALTNCPTDQFVKLDAGTFYVDTFLTIKGHRVLRGSGKGITIIKGKATGFNQAYLVLMGDSAQYLGGAINLSSGYSKGSTRIVSSTSHGLSANDYIILDQLNTTDISSTGIAATSTGFTGSGFLNAGMYVGETIVVAGFSTGGINGTYTVSALTDTTITTSPYPGATQGSGNTVTIVETVASDVPFVSIRGNNGLCTWAGRSNGIRAAAQVCKVTNIVNTTTFDIEIPLMFNYSVNKSPQILKMFYPTEYAGIEHLTLDNSNSGQAAQNDYAILHLWGCFNSWVYNVEFKYIWSAAIFTIYTYRCTFRQNMAHEFFNGAYIYGYGYLFGKYTTSCLFEGNDSHNVLNGFITTGAIQGNVIAYNYFHDVYDDEDPLWNKYAQEFHGAFGYMNLLEGNYFIGMVGTQNVWGSSAYNVFFRNRIELQDGRTSGRWDIEVEKHCWYVSYVGNVVGTVGEETQYEQNGGTWDSQTERSIYHLGYWDQNNANYQNWDSNVHNTLLLHGNWLSYKSGGGSGMEWNGADDQTLPISLYTATKPSWVGTGVQWPPIGPDISPMYPGLPADGSSPFEVSAYAESMLYNILYTNLANGSMNLSSDTIKAALVNSSYVHNPDQNYFSDITGEITGTGYSAGGVTLTGKSVVQDDANDLTKFDANDASWPGATFSAAGVVLYKATGNPATSPLIAYFSFGGMQPVSGDTFNVVWSFSGILRLRRLT